MNRKRHILINFLLSGSAGTILAFLFLYLSSFPGSSLGKRILRRILYPALLASDELIRVVFSHNRIGPSSTEVLLFNVLFVILCAISAGVLGLIALNVYREIQGWRTARTSWAR
jgi:hypothetical protein